MTAVIEMIDVLQLRLKYPLGMVPHILSQHKCDITKMRYAMAKSDHPSTVARLINKLTGPARIAVNKAQVKVELYDTPDGYLEFLDWLRQAVGSTGREEVTKHFEYYFHTIKRVRGQP